MRIELVQKLIDKIRGKKNHEIKPENISKPYIKPKRTYKKLITTTGFGHSGSGVIIDLLSEFDNTSVYGGHDKNGGSPLSQTGGINNIEVDFIRRYGGVFDLEKAFTDYNAKSFMHVLNFIHLSEYYYKMSASHIYNDKYMELTKQFIEKITEGKIYVPDPLAGQPAFKFQNDYTNDYQNLLNPFVYNTSYKKRHYYIVKNLSSKEYRKIAKEYIQSIFNMINSKDYLVLDQLLSDNTADISKYHDYIGNYKQVAVYRDPRDVYVTGFLLNENWIPNNQKDFVLWYRSKNIDKYIANESDNSITVRFEDLVLDYDNTVPKIIEFLGLKKENHIAPKTQFRPEYSKRNIGLFKNFEDQDAIKYIEANLSEYCYDASESNMPQTLVRVERERVISLTAYKTKSAPKDYLITERNMYDKDLYRYECGFATSRAFKYYRTGKKIA